MGRPGLPDPTSPQRIRSEVRSEVTEVTRKTVTASNFPLSGAASVPKGSPPWRDAVRPVLQELVPAIAVADEFIHQGPNRDPTQRCLQSQDFPSLLVDGAPKQFLAFRYKCFALRLLFHALSLGLQPRACQVCRWLAWPAHPGSPSARMKLLKLRKIP